MGNIRDFIHRGVEFVRCFYLLENKEWFSPYITQCITAIEVYSNVNLKRVAQDFPTLILFDKKGKDDTKNAMIL